MDKYASAALKVAKPLATKYAEKASQYASTFKKESEAPKEATVPKESTEAPKESEVPKESTEVPKESDVPKETTDVPKEATVPKESTDVPKESVPKVSDKPDPPEISFIQQISNRMKEGKFPSVDLKFLPPLPAFPQAEVLKIVMSLNKILQDNLETGKKYINVYMENETAQIKHKLDITNALAEEAKNADLEKHVDKYINKHIDHLV